MMDEHMHFLCYPDIVLHGFHEPFLEYVYIIFEFWVKDVTENVRA